MQKITISIDEGTLGLVDDVAAQLSLDRSSVIRVFCKVAMIGLGKMGTAEDGLQTSSGENTERA